MSEERKDYQYIYFKKMADDPKKTTSIWSCHNTKSGARLGTVNYHTPWRCYVYQPAGPSIYSTGCLADIKDFIDNLKGG